jgi:spermidine synthase
MQDGEFERATNQIFLDNAHGDVLVGGLGIGLIIKAIEDNENVTSITIVEKHQEVIDLITEQVTFNEKVTIICANYHTYVPETTYDTIWLDDWTSPEEDEEYRENQTFIGDSREQWKNDMLPYLNEGGYIDYWKPELEQ